MIKFSEKFPFNRQGLKKICRQQDIDLLILHGSYATGDIRKESDIDIGILIRGHLPGEKYRKILDELTGALGDRCDCVLLNEAESMIVYQVAVHGVVLYERTKGLFDDFVATAISRYQDAAKFRNLEKEYIQSHLKLWGKRDER